MPRTKRLVSDDAVLHIVQRGNNKQTIFREDEDFEKFLYIIPDFAIAKSARRADRLNPTGFNLARRGNPKQISNANFGSILRYLPATPPVAARSILDAGVIGSATGFMTLITFANTVAGTYKTSPLNIFLSKLI